MLRYRISVHWFIVSSWEAVAGKGTFMDETVEDALAGYRFGREGMRSVEFDKGIYYWDIAGG